MKKMENNEQKALVIQKEFYNKKKFNQIKQNLKKGVKLLSIIILIVTVILVIIKSITFIKQINIFNISNVEVTGNKVLSFKDVVDILDLSSTNNIFQISINKLKNKLELHPRIKTVKIKRILPDKLIINIEERDPVALINIKKDLGNNIYEIDAEGKLIGEEPHIQGYDLPIITDYQVKDVILGDKVTNNSVISVLNSLKKINSEIYNFNKIIAEININEEIDERSITLYLDLYNIKVIFGKQFTEDKLYKLNSFLLACKDKLNQIEYIDYKYNEIVSKYKT